MKKRVSFLGMLCFWVSVLSFAQIQPSEAELQTYKKLKEVYTLVPAKAPEAQLLKARDFATGVVKGTQTLDLSGSVDKQVLLRISTALEALAASPADKELCRSFIGAILSQGISENIDFTLPTNDYSTVRILPKGFLASLQVADSGQKEQLLGFLAKVLDFKTVYLPDDQFFSRIEADVLTNVATFFYSYAVSQPDANTAIQHLRALTRYLNRVTEYVPGQRDMLKPDGTGFHHKSHYNNYMYSYESWIKLAWLLKSTPFQVAPEAYRRMSKAVVSIYLMAPCGTGDIRYTANSLAGRNPYGRNGVKVQVSKENFKKLIEIGGALENQAFDPQLAADYNFFFQSEQYKVGKHDLNGFYQFNYSPIGIYRNDNWVVTMRCPTSKFWGAEIYNKQNRFGRYQSHGSLEVMYEGPLSKSGCPADDMSGGWDWNVVPGTTTVHYTSWPEMMPSGNTSQRFDQFARTTNFAGALAWGKTGLFAADLDQIDKWGKQTFEPTHLVFRKSVFAINGMLFCMGSNISASGNYKDNMITATNLFQSIRYSGSGKLLLNGKEITEGYDQTLRSDQLQWILNPQSTAYIIPPGNNELVLTFGKQTTPNQTGSDAQNPETTVTASKAYLNHGVKTRDKSYFFIVKPNSNAQELAGIVKKADAKKNVLYEIIRQDSLLHALKYKPQNIRAYSVFKPFQSLNSELLLASETPLLLLVRQESASLMKLAACNPNLNPVANKDFGWISSPTHADILLKGSWTCPDNHPTIRTQVIGGNTKVSFTLQDGAPVYFNLIPGK